MPEPNIVRIATEELRRVAAGEPLLDNHVRAVVGRSVQIRIPVRDVPDLRRVSAILRSYANRLDALSHDRKRGAGSVILEAWAEGRATQGRLDSKPQRD